MQHFELAAAGNLKPYPLATEGTPFLFGGLGRRQMEAGSGNGCDLASISDAINIQLLIKLAPTGVGLFPLMSLFKKKKKISKWALVH